jgi:transposase
MKIDGRTISRDALEAFRFRAIYLRKQGYSISEIANIFGLNYYSIAHWFTKHKKYGKASLKKTVALGANFKLDSSTILWIKKALIKPATEWGFSTPLWNSRMVSILLKQEKDIELDVVTTWRYLCRMGLSFQQPQQRYQQQNKKLVREWIENEWPKIQQWVKKNRAILYFEDESGISLAPVIGKTWAPKGETPIIRVSGSRGGVLAMSAISPTGRVRFRLEERKINAKVMIEFLKQIGQSHKNRKVAVVMDQAPSHTAKNVKNFIDGQKQLKIFYIPPYSPELNPDEKVWRHLKNISLKNNMAKDKNHLARMVVSALRKIQKNPELTMHFFENYLV